MRFVFLLLFLAGLTAGVGAPFLAGRLSDPLIGTWRAYAPTSGFRAVTLPLKAADAPVAVLIDLSAPAPFTPDAALSSLSLTVSHDNRTVLAKAVTFDGAALRDDNPQTPERTFRASAGTLGSVADGSYTFTVARGEAEIPQVTAFDLVLERGAGLDRRIQPVGFAAMAVGFIGFMLSAFRQRTSAEAAAPKPRWGRSAGA